MGKLDEKEIKELYEYIHSPYFNKNRNIRSFFDAIYPYHPSFEKLPPKEAIFKSVYPSESYFEQKINDLMSYVVSAIQDFLSYQEYQQHGSLKNIHLLTALRKKHIDKDFIRISRQVETSLDKGNHDEEYYYQTMRLEQERDQFYIAQEEKELMLYLQRKMDALDRYYLTAKLKSACEMINRQIVYSASFHIPLLDELNNYVHDHSQQFENVPAVNIYYTIYLCLTRPEEEEHYNELVKLLEDNISFFSPDEQKELYGYAQNYCIRKLNSGADIYNRKLHELYLKFLKIWDAFENDYLSQWDYKNIVSTALRLKEFEWTSWFIDHYKDRIHPDYRLNAYRYNKAFYYYEVKNYTEAIRQLRDVEFNDNFYVLGARSILLKIYYEQEEEEALRTSIESFKNFLKRNKKLSSYHKTIYNNLLACTSRLNAERQKLSLKKNKSVSNSFTELGKDIEGRIPLAYSSWLKQQWQMLRQLFQ